MTEQDKAWDALVKMARDSIEDSKKDVYNGLLSCAPEEAILAADAELTSLRARIEVLEKAVIDIDEAMRGDYHREGTKIRIVVTQESLNKFRAALDALKEGK